MPEATFMHVLLYISEFNIDFDITEIAKIIHIAREYNAIFGVTGVLAFDGEQFIQYIEGEDNAVLQLYRNIQADTRHSNLKLISSHTITQRLFPAWSMGYKMTEQSVRFANIRAENNGALALQMFLDSLGQLEIA